MPSGIREAFIASQKEAVKSALNHYDCNILVVFNLTFGHTAPKSSSQMVVLSLSMELKKLFVLAKNHTENSLEQIFNSICTYSNRNYSTRVRKYYNYICRYFLLNYISKILKFLLKIILRML
jgi:hypothetical protein